MSKYSTCLNTILLTAVLFTLVFLALRYKHSNQVATSLNDDALFDLVLSHERSSDDDDDDDLEDDTTRDEWMYLNSMNFNFSFEGFSAKYKKKLKQALEYQENLALDFFEKNPIERDVPLIIWWTPYYNTSNGGWYRTCGGESWRQPHKCFFTNTRLYRLKNRARQRAYIFDGSNFHLHDLPLPRRKLDQWTLVYRHSSPADNLLLWHDAIIGMFNHTATFSRHSDMPLLAQHLTSIDDLESERYVVATTEKTRLQRDERLAPVVYFESTCDSPSDRDTYVRALMKHIRVDSYGKCLNNRALGTKNSSNISSEELYELLAKYKFIIAMENAVCDDYVSDVLWRAFYVGSVPIVFGSNSSPRAAAATSASARDIYPDEETTIEVTRFASARELAARLHELNANDTAYDEYLRFKRPGGVKSRLLRDMITKTNKQSSTNTSAFVERFECFVCERVSETVARRRENKSRRAWQARRSHFECAAPFTFTSEGIAIFNSSQTEDYRPSSFRKIFEFDRIKIRVLYENFILAQRYLFNFRDLMNETLKRMKSHPIRDEL